MLGFSAIHTQPPSPPGEPAAVTAWRLPQQGPDGEPVLLNRAPFEKAFLAHHDRLPSPDDVLSYRSASATQWLHYFDDVAAHLPPAGEGIPPWQSATVPGLKAYLLTPGIIAPEAAAVRVPVFVAMGERDVIAEPHREPDAYRSSSAVDLFVCPGMGHMHNFAATRELFWKRIHAWGEWIRDARH